MRNEVKKLLLACVLFTVVFSLNAQLSRHGLVINGGTGCMDAVNMKDEYSSRKIDYIGGLSAGYRLRFNDFSNKSFHYDIDMNAGAKLFNTTTWFFMGLSVPDGYNAGEATEDYFTSISGTVNYVFLKKMSIGLGVEPTCYFRKKIPGSYDLGKIMVRNSHFDIPLVAKIAFNFRAVEVGIYGKYGLVDVLGTATVQTRKYREIQLSVFIPFKTK